MIMSPKEQWRQQISDYDILFIKGGWLVDKSNRPLPFVNQENRGGWGGGRMRPSSHGYKGQKYPMTRQIGSMSLKNFSMTSYKTYLMEQLFENSSVISLTVQCVDIKIAFLLFRDVHKLFWAFRITHQIQHCEDLVSHIKGVHDKKHITDGKLWYNEYIIHK